ncbi:MAG TPA: dTMP kinase [Candidatus Acidoferrales bacterium]|jgi:dTMP kinase|nr:dTMP kinase [Candidatus Acidoferrales bacterium]
MKDRKKETYGVVLPGMELSGLVGKLIVIEGTDGVGRSTQISLLKEWLEQKGHAVLDTGLSRSGLVGKGIKRAKEGHTLGRITLTLFYATDFADRLEHEIVPALRAGFVVLTDRYIYSLIARAIVRGLDPEWVRKVYGFALKPDAVFYLRIGVDDLIPRVVFSRGFDYWESGMDVYSTEDMYEGFRKYQTSLLEQFDRLADEYNFKVVDATPEPKKIFEKLRAGITKVLEGESPRPALEVTSGGSSPVVTSLSTPEQPGQQEAAAAAGASVPQTENVKV